MLPVVAKLDAAGIVLKPLLVAIAYPLLDTGKVIVAVFKFESTIVCGNT